MVRNYLYLRVNSYFEGECKQVNNSPIHQKLKNRQYISY